MGSYPDIYLQEHGLRVSDTSAAATMPCRALQWLLSLTQEVAPVFSWMAMNRGRVMDEPKREMDGPTREYAPVLMCAKTEGEQDGTEEKEAGRWAGSPTSCGSCFLAGVRAAVLETSERLLARLARLATLLGLPGPAAAIR